jgi:hypothetical protein
MAINREIGVGSHPFSNVFGLKCTVFTSIVHVIYSFNSIQPAPLTVNGVGHTNVYRPSPCGDPTKVGLMIVGTTPHDARKRPVASRGDTVHSCECLPVLLTTRSESRSGRSVSSRSDPVARCPLRYCTVAPGLHRSGWSIAKRVLITLRYAVLYHRPAYCPPLPTGRATTPGHREARLATPRLRLASAVSTPTGCAFPTRRQSE